MIQTLDEDTVRRLAIRVLSRGIGSLEFIQSQLVPEDENADDSPMINVHGSPIRRLTVRESSGPSDIPDLDVEDLPQPANPPSPERPLAGERIPMPDRPGPPTPPVPEWCKCGHYRQMPRAIENICCKKKDCVTLTLRFHRSRYPTALYSK